MVLKNRFLHTFYDWIPSEKARYTYWDILEKHYSEPFRAYHNFTHLNELFGYFEAYKTELKNPKEIAFAIFYHDIIYDIGSKSNERLSAELAQKHLTFHNVKPKIIERIYNLILVTKTHHSTGDPDEQWMIDFDLAILGQPWNVYQIYTERIRKEFSKVPDRIYRNGRRNVLKHFLTKKYIYQTAEFQNSYEDRARKNLLKELNAL